MGQRCELEMTLAAIRRKKKVYIKNLDLEGISEEMKEQLIDDIDLMSTEEAKILSQLGLDNVQ